MDLLAEVWERDTTLVDVLDDSGIGEIPSIQSKINAIQEEQSQQKDQLDSLGHTVDNNQKSNEARILDLYTNVNSNTRDLQRLEQEVKDLTLSIGKIQLQMHELELKVSANSQIVDDMTYDLEVVKGNVLTLAQDMNKLNNELLAIKPDVSELKSQNVFTYPFSVYANIFLQDICAVYEGSKVTIVDIGGSSIEYQVTTIGNGMGRKVSSPVKYVKRYELVPSVVFNKKVYQYISFVGINRTISQPAFSDDPIVTWGYQVIKLSNNVNLDAMSIMLIKEAYVPVNFSKIK